MTKPSVALVATGILLTAVLGAAVPVAAAGAPSATVVVGPNQSFIGLVNGHLARATIEVVCPGPLRINQRGYALSGQTIGVASPSPVSAPLGFTGSRADSIVARLLTPTSTAAGTTVIFTHYGNQPLPTTVLLPCDGTSTALFLPRPSSPTARSSPRGRHLRADLRRPRLPRHQERSARADAA